MLYHLYTGEPLVTPLDEMVRTLSLRPEMSNWFQAYEMGIVDLDPYERMRTIALKTYGPEIEGRHWLTGRYCLGIPTTPVCGTDM